MNSNPRLERLKELMSLEERRVSAQQQLDSITARMSTLRDSLFEEGTTAPAKPAATRSSAATAPKAETAPAPQAARRGRKPGRKAGRAKRGALKEQIVSALHSAGNAGVRVTE